MMKYTIIILTMIGCLLSSCNHWLDLEPESERLAGDYWTSKDDIKNTMMSCYSRMRKCQLLFLQWGELRGDVFKVKSDEKLEDEMEMSRQNLNSENVLTKWSTFYSVINAANAVIQYAPTVLDKDPLLTKEEMNQYVAEAKTVRALLYFYLIKTFRDVPLITDAYLVDEQKLIHPKKSEKEIIDQIILDLNWSLKRLEVSYGPSWENKCRATRWAAQTLLADIYLWNEEYEKCATACELIINSGRFELLRDIQEEDTEYYETRWFDIFYPGLSEESIWELFYDHVENQKNTMYTICAGSSSKAPNYTISEFFKEDFESKDIRGLGGSFDEDLRMWKFLGVGKDKDDLRPTTERSPNWIFYRLSEVYLIYADACLMLDNGSNSDYLTKAVGAINMIRGRAEIDELDIEKIKILSQEDKLKLILEERKKEFVGEGKRWFDLVRVARRGDFSLYKVMVIDVLLGDVPLAEKALYRTKLANSHNFYLPINQIDIDVSGGVLVQNPAYQ